MATYEVMFKIERITFGCEPLAIGNVTFQNLTSEIVEAWTMDNENVLLSLLDDAGNQPVGVVKVDNISDANKASEYALDEFDRALNILRVCVGSFRSTTIYDEQLLQRRNGLAAIRQVKPQPKLLGISIGRNFGHVDLGLSGTLADSTNEFIGKLTPLYDGTIQGRLHAALIRSLEWIGTSITRDNCDHKVVDLCTALEAALTTKDDPRKGEAIALRMMLLAMSLDKRFRDPGELYRIYEKRSQVVHGSALGVCERSDYYRIRAIAEESVLRIIELNGKQSSVTRKIRLIRHLESVERVEKALTWLKQWADKDTQAVAKYAEDKLSELNPTPQHTSGKSE